jgi:hypothetical protein
MSAPLIPSLDVIQRTLAADISYTVSRMKVLERIPGNPIGIAYRWFDESAVALMARSPPFCRVVGLSRGHAHHIDPLARWYAEHDTKPTFEMVPGQYDASLGQELARLGFMPRRRSYAPYRRSSGPSAFRRSDPTGHCRNSKLTLPACGGNLKRATG